MAQTTQSLQKSRDIPSAKAENCFQRIWRRFSEQVIFSMDGSGDEGSFLPKQAKS